MEELIEVRCNQATESVYAVEEIIDILSNNGGMHLYEKYLQSKDDSHCSHRIIQFFEEGIQFSFFPGDPGESEDHFAEEWAPDIEPVQAEIDHWATQIVKSKIIVKVDNNQIEDMNSTVKSKNAISIASSKKTVKMKKIQSYNRKDSELKSKLGDSIKEKSERKENQNSNTSMITNNMRITSTSVTPQQNLIPLEVPPPREIPLDEKILRDRKEKQLKMKEIEIKEQQEKEEREEQRMKNKQDAFAELEKSEYTYDYTGKILMIKKPNLQNLIDNQIVAPEVQLDGNKNKSAQQQSKVPIKNKSRLTSAKAVTQKELQVIQEARKEESIMQEKAELELQENYNKIFYQEEESLKEYGLQKDPFEVGAGIVHTDKQGRKIKGPKINRENKMTLNEYQKIASQFEILDDGKKSRYGSGNRLLSQENYSQADFIKEEEISIQNESQYQKGSPEKIVKKIGADIVYEKEVNFTQQKLKIKAMRKDLKSANVKDQNQNIIDKHNEFVRITSAKQQQDVRIRKTSVKKVAGKDKIFNYDLQITNEDFNFNSQQSRITESRPQSNRQSNLLNKKNLFQGALSNGFEYKQNQPKSLIDEFNKKLVEKGTNLPVLPSELPQVSKYLEKKKERPMTSKPVMKNSSSRSKLQVPLSQDHNERENNAEYVKNQIFSSNFNSSQNVGGFLNTKTEIQKKAPRERIISAKLPKEKDKLPPPPFGKTMGHGLMVQQFK